MAGIGFVLRRALARDTFLGAGRAYLAAAVISSGPWLLSVATLLVISVFATATLPPSERDVLFAAVMYAFALSLIGVGPIQMAVTRHLADRLYLGDDDAVGPTFVGTATLALVVLSCPVAALCLGLTDLPLLFRLAMLALFVGSVGTWLALIFLSAARDYAAIALAFVAGYGVGGLCAVTLGPSYGATGYLVGFALGQLLIFARLALIVLAEFAFPNTWRLGAFGYLGRYPSLVVVGLAYNLAIWADKAIFWYAPSGVALSGFLHVSPSYDVAVFLSSLAAAPALMIFLVQVETTFYEQYRAFFEGIGAKHSLRQLKQARRGMVAALRASFGLLVKVEAAVVLTGLVLAEWLYAAFGLPPSDVVLFRNLVVANGVQVLMLISLLVLLYFDLRFAAALTSVAFLVANVALTTVTLQLGPRWYGLGYGGAALCALTIAQVLLWRHLAELEFRTFSRQPIAPRK